MPVLDTLINWFIGENAREEQDQIREQQRGKLNALKAPEFSAENYLPKMLQDPGDAQYTDFQLSPEVRDEQMAGLKALMARANGAADAEQDLGRYRAISRASDMARQQSQAVMNDAAARGVSGGGLEFAMRAMGGQESANRAQEAGLTSAAQAAMEKLTAQAHANQGLSAMRAQDQQEAFKRSDIINEFNRYNNQQRWNKATFDANAANAGSMYNMDRGDRNVLTRSDFEVGRYDRDAALSGQKSQSIGDRAANAQNAVSGTVNDAMNIGMMAAGIPPVAVSSGSGRMTSGGNYSADEGMTLRAKNPATGAGSSQDYFDQRRRKLTGG